MAVDLGLPAGQGKPGQAARQQAAQGFINQNVPTGMQGLIKHPVQFAQNAIRGQGPATRKLAYLRAISEAGGYGTAQNALQQKYLSELNNPTVNTLHDMSPTVGRLSAYVQDRLGVGLTPEEESMIRSRGIAQNEGNAAVASRDAGQRLAAAGIDPRSGIAADRYGQIERSREAGRAGVEQDITQEDLARKQQMEQLAANTAQLEEAGRQYDVGANLKRQGMVESGLGALAGESEQQRQYDTSYTEGQRQAEMARKAWQKAGAAMAPSALEKWSQGIGGFLGGLGA